MNFFKKIFGSSDDASDEENESVYAGTPTTDSHLSIDERFIFNFKKNGGKFLYCENKQEVAEQFENILEENDWFENEVLCYEPGLFHLLEENKLLYISPRNPKFLLATCENLIADEGSILFSSKQIRQDKPNELPANIVIIATTSQMQPMKSDGLSAIKRKYERDIPSNITTIKYFEKAKEEDFTQYGSVAKNLYLLLLEDL
ncbi:lactate utilization protein B/C [Flavobacterium sp. ANB]|uniref:lactate utilization protein B/C n=1 Tax=unclassified Flavobacterium TaxID=196869 RepID=UPI0012B73F5F|nr:MULTISPECIES: lactate utilization protein B/C [unclassified Flavobacterium]MBF4519109.1 lactate utilization protein B/C [Flavobacterium sp. ANB]MTD71691.1 lactate utilization protein B/C [Flavobacterium sp. LC2016-13]